MKSLLLFKPTLLICLLSALSLTACQGPTTNKPTAQSDGPLVGAGGEQLHGKKSEQFPEITEFLGVPFAAPPIADLRWRAPHEHKVREGVQDATRYAAACYQNSGGVDWYIDTARTFGHSADVVGRPVALSEDCLYLNVWTPVDLSKNTQNQKLPVMVWIHGGGNTGGWAYEPNYVGASLARRGVVIVSIAYRLGMFGFFSHPGMDDDQQPYTANFGLLDQIKGLEWVKSNISQFGGDPNNVTVAGESAGSANIGYMLASPMARDLFQRSIHQSGSFELTDFNTKETVHAHVQTFDRSADASNSEHLASLRALDAAALLALADARYSGDLSYPVIDGKVLPNSVFDFYANQQNQARDMMVGSTKDEWLMYLDEPQSKKVVDDWLTENLPSADKAEVYRELENHPSLHKKLELLVTARMMRCPGYYLAEKNAAQGGRSWVYQFDRVRPGSAGASIGSYHGAELPYMFDTHDSWLPTEAVDRQLTSVMVDYWVNFVKTGDPNSTKSPNWPAYSKSSSQVQLLDELVRSAAAPHMSLCAWLGPGS